MQGGHHTTHTANSLLTNMPVTLLTLPSWCTKHAVWAKPFLGAQPGVHQYRETRNASLFPSTVRHTPHGSSRLL